MNNKNPVYHSLDIIESRISEKLTVENIAKSVYFSKYHYQRLFSEIVGNSVMEYVTKRKLTLAGKELLETNTNILDIALKYGFDSHEGFTRSFKSYMGVTPTDYRKFNLAAISQKTVKERCVMMYSKTTDEIIRELNDFIAKAKDLANSARKGSELPEYLPFWQKIAEKTDVFANATKDILERITVIAEHPDEITNRFTIIKVIEDIAFQSNLLAFNVGLMVSRDTPERVKKQEPLCIKYHELAKTSVLKASKTAQFLNELSALIFSDMRKSAAEKIQVVIQKGNAAVNDILGYSYIKHEVAYVVREITAIPIEEISISRLEDYIFKLNIISFASDMDIIRNPKDKALFNGITLFKESLSDAIEFFQTFIKSENNPVLERTIPKNFLDIAYQGNILLFYTRGELSQEKLGHLLSNEQKAAFEKICGKINDFIHFTHNAINETAYKEIANKLYEIKSDMVNEADKLNGHGVSVKFLANEFGILADRVTQYISCC